MQTKYQQVLIPVIRMGELVKRLPSAMLTPLFPLPVVLPPVPNKVIDVEEGLLRVLLIAPLTLTPSLF